MLLFLLLLGTIFAYFLYYKPEIIAVILFTIVISDLNFTLPGLPLNLRAIISVALFLRIFIDSSLKIDFPPFFILKSSLLFFGFFAMAIIVSAFYDLLSFDLLKQVLSSLLSAYCAYFFYCKNNNANILKTSLMLAGLICFADLFYTYFFIGNLPIIRIYEVILYGEGNAAVMVDENVLDNNHNFFGQICGMALVFFVTDFIKKKTTNILSVIFMFVMLAGVILSTSRSALLGCVLIILFVLISGFNIADQRRKVLQIVGYGFIMLFFTFLLLLILGPLLNIEGSFIEEMVARLIDEPIAMIQKSLGQNYNIQNLGAGDWRAEAAANAYNAFLQLNISEQFFGIGIGGFMQRNLGHGLNPHNGVMLILIENGIIGLLIYFFLVVFTLWRSFKLRNISGSFATLFFIIVYSINQNSELTQPGVFLFLFTLIGEMYFLGKQSEKYMFSVA